MLNYKCLHCFNPRTRVKDINHLFKKIEFLFYVIEYPVSSIEYLLQVKKT